MSRSTSPAPGRSSRHSINSIVRLALWNWRQHRFLLLVTGVGMITAVMLVCTTPLLTEVMQTAGLRSVLNATPDSAEITLRATVAGLSTQNLENVYQSLSPPLQEHLGAYLNGPPALEILSPEFGILSPRPPDITDQVQIDATSMREATSHVTLFQGRLPQTMSQDVEVAITPATASKLHVGLDSVIMLDVSFYREPVPVTGTPRVHQQLKLHVVGLFNIRTGDPFWHGDDFLAEPTEANIHFMVLAALDSIAQNANMSQVFFSKPSSIYWYHRPAPSRISINQLDDLIGQLATTQVYIENHFRDPYMVLKRPYMQSVDLFGPTLSSTVGPGCSTYSCRHSHFADSLPFSICSERHGSAAG